MHLSTAKYLRSLISFICAIPHLPRVEINLMLERTKDNDPFFKRITNEIYQAAQQRHSKFPLITNMKYGVAICPLPQTFVEYLKLIESSAIRNRKKADRLGYQFERINFNNHLEDIQAIRRSTDVRQGRLPDDFLTEKVEPCKNPISRNPCHDYPYFGVVKDGHLYAYAGCLIAGELCMIEHIYGHAAHQENGVVPLLYTGIAGYLYEHHPQVRCYGYGMFFGASESMKRFKKKFHFLPHRVRWILGE